MDDFALEGAHVLSGGISRKHLQRLSNYKIDDASFLFSNGRFSSASYRSGYAVELALKACIARRIVAETIPDKDFVTKIYVHDYLNLIKLAGLSAEPRQQQDADQVFHANWGIAAQWGPEVRYGSFERSETQFLLNWISDRSHGVLQWIRKFW